MLVTQRYLPTHVWTSGMIIFEISYDLSSAWTVNDLVDMSRTEDIYTNLQGQYKDSAFEKAMQELVKEGLVTANYVQDVFQQEQLFKDDFERIRKEYPEKDIVVCGGEVFVCDTLEDVEKKARDKYRNRPTYSYGPTLEL